MSSFGRRLVFVVGLSVVVLSASAVWAARLVMRDGRVIQGRIALVGATVENPQSPSEGRNIVLVDDGLRQIFLPQRQVQEVNELDAGEPVEKFLIPQQVCDNGLQIAAVGGIGRITPFDDFGRRTLEMVTNRGKEELLQGITEITPEWTKIECVETKSLHYTWDMRIATSMIPRQDLERILSKQIDPNNLDQRLKIVRLYIQSQRFADAEAELQDILRAFPDRKAQFLPTTVLLRQAHARRILEELEKRRAAGQHVLCRSLLENFPAENVAGETLQQVREMLDEYQGLENRGRRALTRLDELIEQLHDSALKSRLGPIRDEIRAELSLNTLDRLAAFLQFESEATMPPEDRVALAVSGWLVGGDYALRKLPTALSMFDARNLIRKYLVESLVGERRAVLEELKRQEGFTPELTARLLAAMKPPVETPAPPPFQPPTDGAPPQNAVGMYRLQVDSLPGESPVDYLVQLPPEYDPNRRYPVIVTLHGAGSTPEMQIEWWAGGIGPDGQRYGHAGRNGYIVVAPRWAKEQQLQCNYADYEHAAVIYALRDVYRRFAVDTDRVFLTGHSMGGDAAWDIALTNPDLWAGFIAVTPTADKTTTFLWENAQYVPGYLVAGQMDGERWVKNSVQMDRYLNRGYDTTIVRFLGRGHEHFADETIRLYDWMNRRKRDPFPRKFKCRSATYSGNSFWWVEIADPPPATMVDPDNWPPKNVGLLYVEGELTAKNGLRVTTGAGKVVAWLSPELIDFAQPCDVYLRGQKANKGRFVEPDAAVILDDARARGDRQHPFWAKVESGR